MQVLGAFPRQTANGGFNMSKKLYPTDVLEQAQSVLAAWNQIDSEVTFGSLNNAALTTDVTQASQLLTEMNTLEAQITDLRNQRDALYQEMWDKVKRVRNGVKANYGDDSSQYEMVGGTRLSERKPSTRKAKA
jgi:hypothetical protein